MYSKTEIFKSFIGQLGQHFFPSEMCGYVVTQVFL